MAETEDTAVEAEATESAPDRAVFLELEYAGVNGRQIVYDVFKSVLADRSIDLSVADFSRYCLCSPVEDCLPDLLAAMKKTRISEEKLRGEIADGIRLSFTDGSTKLDANINRLVEEVSQQGAALGVVSCMEKGAANELADKLGLVERGAAVVSQGELEGGFPQGDVWNLLARQVSVAPSRCVAVVTSGDAARSCLNAGVGCVVASDRFTAFQDFGGADMVFDSLDAEAVDRIVAMVSEV